MIEGQPTSTQQKLDRRPFRLFKKERKIKILIRNSLDLDKTLSIEIWINFSCMLLDVSFDE